MAALRETEFAPAALFDYNPPHCIQTPTTSISARAREFVMPISGASSGDENEPGRMTEQQRPDLMLRIRRFEERRKADAAMLQPRREGIVALQQQVDFVRHPESIPR